MLEVIDQETLARDLRQIYTMLSSGLPVTEENAAAVGATIRVATGPLTGMVGKVIRRGKRDEFVAMVQFLGAVRWSICKTGRWSRSTTRPGLDVTRTWMSASSGSSSLSRRPSLGRSHPGHRLAHF